MSTKFFDQFGNVFFFLIEIIVKERMIILLKKNRVYLNHLNNVKNGLLSL